MFCVKCGAEMPEGARFCAYCGIPLPKLDAPEPKKSAAARMMSALPEKNESYKNERDAISEPEYEEDEQKYEGEEYSDEADEEYEDEEYSDEADEDEFDDEYYDDEDDEPHRSHFVRNAIIIFVALVLLGGAAYIGVPHLLAYLNQNKYNEAATYLTAGQYAEAEKLFIELGDFSDSAIKAEEAAKYADYSAAKTLMESGDYQMARTAFEALGDFCDSAVLKKECSNEIDYAAACALMDAQSFAEAATLFEGISDFKDAATKGKTCRETANYEQGKVLMAEGKYAGAAELFAAISEYKDAASLGKECSDRANYAMGQRLFAEGEVGDAYFYFMKVKTYADAIEQAKKCLTALPMTGETYRDKAFADKTCTLKIVPPDKTTNDYVKIYTADGKLISCVFIRKGDTLSIGVPAGDYKINMAYSTYDVWFGEEELFGRYGKYQTLTFGDNAEETTTFRKGYTYTLSLRSGEGDAVPKDVEREKF